MPLLLLAATGVMSTPLPPLPQLPPLPFTDLVPALLQVRQRYFLTSIIKIYPRLAVQWCPELPVEQLQ